LAEYSRQTIQNSGSTSESRSGFARSLFRLDGLPRLRDQPPHSPAAIFLKSLYPPPGKNERQGRSTIIFFFHEGSLQGHGFFVAATIERSS